MGNVVKMDDVRDALTVGENVEAIISRRREEILEAAFEIFVEHGYEGANTLAIARRARTSKETLYNYFGSKQMMFEELVDRMSERMYGGIADTLDEDEVDFLNELRRLGACLLRVWGHNHNIALLRIAAAYAHTAPQFGQKLGEKTDACVRRLFVTLVKRGHREGFLKVDDLEEAFDAFVGLLIGGYHFRRILGCERQLTDEDAAFRAGIAVDRFVALFSVPPTAD